ncbi:hypothetical protein GCM10010121_086740 [Streptomyces brasiliensis]|uniref:AMP-dependent synthetase/ligase domain-containing protein n=2 Tax=Streptomyces brasiliensis TaxID=1954 RepID=A0A917P5M9_9ACTN|nr:hypothetical protein GCM10010121_086740 [Streptomyces brasiliensis]
MLYSSGTTGRPKGIRREVTAGPMGTYPHSAPEQWLRSLGMVAEDVYLSPAPLYHSAPLAWSEGPNGSVGPSCAWSGSTPRPRSR